MSAPRRLHEAIDRAYDEWSNLSALESLCVELDRVKPRSDGWLAAIEAISLRDHSKPLANLGSLDLLEYHEKLLDQLKATPAGVGGAAPVVGAGAAPNDSEDSDGIPD